VMWATEFVGIASPEEIEKLIELTSYVGMFEINVKLNLCFQFYIDDIVCFSFIGGFLETIKNTNSLSLCL
jgi:hypothetical protein